MRFNEMTDSSQKCPHCGGPMFSEMLMMEKKDACYYKVKASAKVWPSAYASGRLVQCRKKGAANYGNKSESVAEGTAETSQQQQVRAAITKGMEKWDQNDKATYQSQPTKTNYMPASGYASDKLTGVDSIDPDGTVVLAINDTKADGIVKKLATLGGMPGVKTRQIQPKIVQGMAENIRVEPVARSLKTQSTQTQPKQNVYVAPDKKTPAVVNHIKQKGVAEDYNPEYDDEAGMADNNLETLRRAVDGLDDVINTGDNLPEWCQEKIAVAKSMLVSVWDYMRSEQDRGANPELAEEFDLIESCIDRIADHNGVDAEMIWEDLESLSHDELYVFAVTSEPIMEDWSKVNKRDKTDGMSQKAVNAYRRENPGSKLKTAVTTKPSKLKKGSKASKRRKSYCSRSRGQMKMHNISCAKTPDKAICKARRRWNC